MSRCTFRCHEQTVFFFPRGSSPGDRLRVSSDGKALTSSKQGPASTCQTLFLLTSIHPHQRRQIWSRGLWCHRSRLCGDIPAARKGNENRRCVSTHILSHIQIHIHIHITHIPSLTNPNLAGGRRMLITAGMTCRFQQGGEGLHVTSARARLEACKQLSEALQASYLAWAACSACRRRVCEKVGAPSRQPDEAEETITRKLNPSGD